MNGRHIILIEFDRDLNNEISKVLISVVQPLDDIYGSFNDQGTPLLYFCNDASRKIYYTTNT